MYKSPYIQGVTLSETSHW